MMMDYLILQALTSKFGCDKKNELIILKIIWMSKKSQVIKMKALM